MPASFSHIKSTDVNAIRYEIVGYVSDMGQKTAVSNELFDLCFRHLGAAGVVLRPLGAAAGAMAVAPMLMPSAPGMERSDDDKVRLLRFVDMFRSVARNDLSQLAEHLTRHDVASGERIMSPDSVTDSLMIVRSGVLSVMLEEGEHTREITRFGPGDTFGEAGLLAGTATGVQISALTPSVLYFLHKDDLSPFLKTHPEVANQLCTLLSRRQDALGKIMAPVPVSDTSAHSAFHWLMEKVQQLHSSGH
jgi:hypothetical protein